MTSRSFECIINFKIETSRLKSGKSLHKKSYVVFSLISFSHAIICIQHFFLLLLCFLQLSGVKPKGFLFHCVSVVLYSCYKIKETFALFHNNSLISGYSDRMKKNFGDQPRFLFLFSTNER